MTASRLKRLRQLEQSREKEAQEHMREQVSRALERLPDELSGALGWELDHKDTPEYDASLSRLLEWGKQIPEIRDAPELGEAAKGWWEQMEAAGRFSFLPVASPEAVEQLEKYAEQWAEVSRRRDCPEQRSAAGLAAAWAWWAALAWESRGEPEPF